VLFLTVSEEVQEKRGDYGGERYETRELQRSVRGVFDRLRADDEGTRPWKVVDADRSVEEVARDIEEAVREVEERVRGENPPIAKLWAEGSWD
jgi:dTMP kinase